MHTDDIEAAKLLIKIAHRMTPLVGDLPPPWDFLERAIATIEQQQTALTAIKNATSKGEMRRIAMQALGEKDEVIK